MHERSVEETSMKCLTSSRGLFKDPRIRSEVHPDSKAIVLDESSSLLQSTDSGNGRFDLYNLMLKENPPRTMRLIALTYTIRHLIVGLVLFLGSTGIKDNPNTAQHANSGQRDHHYLPTYRLIYES